MKIKTVMIRTFSNTITNERGPVLYKTQRFSSINEAKEFADSSSEGYSKPSITSNNLLLSNYVKAARHEPKVSVLFITLQCSRPEEELIVAT